MRIQCQRPVSPNTAKSGRGKMPGTATGTMPYGRCNAQQNRDCFYHCSSLRFVINMGPQYTINAVFPQSTKCQEIGRRPPSWPSYAYWYCGWPRRQSCAEIFLPPSHFSLYYFTRRSRIRLAGRLCAEYNCLAELSLVVPIWPPCCPHLHSF